MDFAVRRLSSGAGNAPNYHLLDAQDNVLIVADQSVMPDAEQRRQVRLARPDGRLLATIDLPLADSSAETADYAIIHDYAVYAILSVHPRVTEDGSPSAPYFTLEVEGERWMALPDPTMDHCYAVYDEVPRGLFPYGVLADLDLPAAIGRLCALDGDHAYTASLDPDRLQQPALVILALAYLIDRTQPAER
jgi:hypothetical protein